MTIDDLMTDNVEPSVAGFGGAFVDPDSGTLNVWLTTPSASRALKARDALAEALGNPTLRERPTSALQAKFPFSTLKRWHDRATAVLLPLDGVITTDIDDRSNRLRIGIVDEAQTESYRTRLTEAGVPADAVDFFQRAPILTESSLRDRHRPLVGGLQIQWPNNNDGLTYNCSLGFIAIRNNVRGFVTNSHCSSTRGTASDATFYSQSTYLFPEIADAIEVADPPFFTGGSCPSTRRCRYSDALFAEITCIMLGCTPATSDLGHVGRPGTIGSPTWDGTTRYRIAFERSPLVGEVLTKVGRTTGRTHGNVDAACVNVNVAGADITMLCQGDGNYLSQGGDSGGPVLQPPSEFGLDVPLAGIHWGSGGIYSPIGQVTAELGSMNTCAPLLGAC